MTSQSLALIHFIVIWFTFVVVNLFLSIGYSVKFSDNSLIKK